MRKQAFFHSGKNHQRKLQPLGRVQRHQCDLRVLVVLIGIANQRSVIEELLERLPAIARVHGRVHQFAQVLDPRVSLRRVFFFQLLDVSRAVDQKFKNFGSIRRSARSAKTLNRIIDHLISPVVGGATGAFARSLILSRIVSSKIKTKVARIKISVGTSLCGKSLCGKISCGDGRLARPSRAQLGSVGPRIAARLRRSRLLHPLHKRPLQHRAPILNQRPEAPQAQPKPEPATTAA